jgi:uncharacterized membrane-anchored protein
MRKVHGVMAATSVAMVLLGLVGAAQAAASQEEQRKVWDDVAQAAKKGPVDVALLDEAVLHLPAGEVFVPQPQADRLLNMWGNPGSNPDMTGVILPTDPKATWFMPVRFQRAGYIKDDDAKSWDADAMLKSFKEGTEEQNKEREKAGIPGLEILGWSGPVRYDATRQRLEWAMASREIGAKPDDPLSVNYNIYALGRDGYFSMNMVTKMADLPALKSVAEQQLAALDYNAGKHYADFDAKTDHVAGYGLAALVVGVTAHKPGFIAVALAFLGQFTKLIIIGLPIIGLAVFGVMKSFTRTPTTAPVVTAPAPAQPTAAGAVAEPPVAQAAIPAADPAPGAGAAPPQSPPGA